MLYAVPRCSPAARATSLAFSGRSDRCSVRRTFAAATIAPTGFPRGPIPAISADLVCAAGRGRFASVAATGAGTAPSNPLKSIRILSVDRVCDNMIQAILGYLNQKHMSSMEDKREGRLYVDNRHARGRSAPVEGTHQEPMVPPTWRHTRLAAA